MIVDYFSLRATRYDVVYPTKPLDQIDTIPNDVYCALYKIPSWLGVAIEYNSIDKWGVSYNYFGHSFEIVWVYYDQTNSTLEIYFKAHSPLAYIIAGIVLVFALIGLVSEVRHLKPAQLITSTVNLGLIIMIVVVIGFIYLIGSNKLKLKGV